MWGGSGNGEIAGDETDDDVAVVDNDVTRDVVDVSLSLSSMGFRLPTPPFKHKISFTITTSKHVPQLVSDNIYFREKQIFKNVVGIIL